MNLGVMATEECSSISRSPELEPHHQIRFNVISRTPFRRKGLSPLQGLLSKYTKPPQQIDKCNLNQKKNLFLNHFSRNMN